MKRIKLIKDSLRPLNLREDNKIDLLDWLKIWEDSEVYFDGPRTHGYGGYKYDGRWKNVVNILIKEYDLNENSNLLDIGCAKGFLVNDFQEDARVGNAAGVDISPYALIMASRLKMKGRFMCSNVTNLPFEDNQFDFVFCKDTLHNILNEEELIIAINEIERVGKKSWIRVAAYNNIEQKQIIDKWATFANCYFTVDKWLNIFKQSSYSGTYDWFHPSQEIV